MSDQLYFPFPLTEAQQAWETDQRQAAIFANDALMMKRRLRATLEGRPYPERELASIPQIVQESGGPAALLQTAKPVQPARVVMFPIRKENA